MGNLVANCLSHWSMEGAAGRDALAKLMIELVDSAGDGGVNSAVARQRIFKRDLFFARSAAYQLRADTLVVRVDEGIFFICFVGRACGWRGGLLCSRPRYMDNDKGNNQPT